MYTYISIYFFLIDWSFYGTVVSLEAYETEKHQLQERLSDALEVMQRMEQNNNQDLVMSAKLKAGHSEVNTLIYPKYSLVPLYLVPIKLFSHLTFVDIQQRIF